MGERKKLRKNAKKGEEEGMDEGVLGVQGGEREGVGLRMGRCQKVESTGGAAAVAVALGAGTRGYVNQ